MYGTIASPAARSPCAGESASSCCPLEAVFAAKPSSACRRSASGCSMSDFAFVVHQQVEDDVASPASRGRACGRGSPPGGCAAAGRRTRACRRRDDDLAVEHEVLCRQRAQRCDHLGEVAAERLAGLSTAVRPRPPSRKARQRKPSHLGSYCHSGPSGMRAHELRLHRRVTAVGSGRLIAGTSRRSQRPASRAAASRDRPASRRARGMLSMRKSSIAHAALDLLPGHRRRHRREGLRPHRIDRTRACGPTRSGCSPPARGPAGRLAIRYSAVMSVGSLSSRASCAKRFGERPDLLLQSGPRTIGT